MWCEKWNRVRFIIIIVFVFPLLQLACKKAVVQELLHKHDVQAMLAPLHLPRPVTPPPPPLSGVLDHPPYNYAALRKSIVSRHFMADPKVCGEKRLLIL
jgi:hypothetical protein